MSFSFLPYQVQWIRDTSKVKLIEKSRQIGFSWVTAYATVREHLTSHQPLQSWIASRDRFQAQLFLEDCRQFTQCFAPLAAHTRTNLLSKRHSQSKSHLYFSNGSSIHALSSNINAQAGKRGTRILDEFALHSDPKALYETAFPGTTWNGQLLIISTHRGANSFFNQLIQEAKHNGNPKHISLHKVTLEDALNQGLLKRIQAKLSPDHPNYPRTNAEYFDRIRASCPSETAFLQEYMCQPADDQSVLIPYDLIIRNEYPAHESWECTLPLPKDRDFYLGVDIGRVHDLTVFWIIEKVHDHYFTRHITYLKDTPFDQQFTVLHQLLSSPSLKRACIDQTGMGRQFVEQAIQAFGQGRIEGVNFTQSTKEALAYPVLAAFQGNQLKVPADDFIRDDLHSIQKQITPGGNVRFLAERNAQGHADRFWALSLALNAAQSHKPKYIHSESFSRTTRNLSL